MKELYKSWKIKLLRNDFIPIEYQLEAENETDAVKQAMDRAFKENAGYKFRLEGTENITTDGESSIKHIHK